MVISVEKDVKALQCTSITANYYVLIATNKKKDNENRNKQ